VNAADLCLGTRRTRDLDDSRPSASTDDLAPHVRGGENSAGGLRRVVKVTTFPIVDAAAGNASPVLDIGAGAG
jgi:hypothetical protein